MIHGYARASTDGQSVAAQIATLEEAGAAKVWREVASGAKTDRADTRDQTAMGRLLRTIMAGFAEFERELIRARTTEGRTRAKERGVKLGRKPKLTQHQQREAAQRRENGEAAREIARSYAVHHSTISRLPSHG